MEMTYEDMLREMEAYYASVAVAVSKPADLTIHEKMMKRFSCDSEDDAMLAALRKHFSQTEAEVWMKFPVAAAGRKPLAFAELEKNCEKEVQKDLRRILAKLLDKKILLHIDNKMGTGYFARCDRHTAEQLKMSAQKKKTAETSDCAVKVMEGTCVGCKLCVKACPVNAIQVEGKVVLINGKACMGCGACVRKCPKNALKM